MIGYTLLGPVSAHCDDWTADLKPQARLLLAALIMAEGNPVPRWRLAQVLWDDQDDPPGGLKRVAAELRGRLREVLPETDPVPGSAEAYRLDLRPDQADVLRFRAQVKAAWGAGPGPGPAALLRSALREWGDQADSLFGGEPLAGLYGGWAESIRAGLRAEYRDARLACLRQDLLDHHDERVAGECRRLAAEPASRREELLIEYWMIATYRAGRRVEAEGIYQSALVSLRDVGLEPSSRLSRLAEVIRTEDPVLDGPGNVGQWTGTTASPASTGRPMNGKNVTVNFFNNASVNGPQVGEVENLIVHASGEVAMDAPQTGEEKGEEDGEGEQTA
ncbi:MAG TPA: bacterial transcriptional activator domain-containing protein [Trebonia sp.]|nr:bacterial transcriptional activator domain-containing protein [Trebonia sp.]